MVRYAASLSVQGLANIPDHGSRNDFNFIVGDRHYPCPWYVADFLSPLICRLHASDLSVDHFVVETPDECGYFADLLSLGRGGTVVLSERNCPFVWSVAHELDNQDLLIQAEAAAALDDSLTVSNAAGQLASGRACNAPVDSIVGYIASHFADFPVGFSAALSCDDMAMILAHPSLALKNEDGLFEHIAWRLRDDPTSFSLFEYLRFEYLSQESVAEFAELVVDHFDRLNLVIWGRISPRLVRTLRIDKGDDRDDVFSDIRVEYTDDEVPVFPLRLESRSDSPAFLTSDNFSDSD